MKFGFFLAFKESV